MWKDKVSDACQVATVVWDCDFVIITTNFISLEI